MAFAPHLCSRPGTFQAPNESSRCRGGLFMCQALETVSRKRGCKVQEFSKRKIFVLGMEVAISTWKGTSLEVVQVRDERFVSGKVSFHARLKKA